MATEVVASARLISHLRQLGCSPWDASVLRRTRLCLLDSLACYCAGRALPHSLPGAQIAMGLFGAAQNLALRSPFTTAYLYGQAANALDYDDTLFGHPGAPIIATVLAVAARDSLSADRLLRGIAAGYEAHAILCAAAAPSREHAAQVRSVGNWDTVAAALGAGIALGLDDDVLERSVGVALAHSLVPYTAKWYERPVPAVKNNMGWIAAGAVLSLELARAGICGITRPLDGNSGMWRMVGSDRWSFEQQFSAKPAVLRTGFKQFPACWHLQEYLKAFSGLLDSLASGDDVKEIVVMGPPDVEKFCPPRLTGTADVAFSLPATFDLLMRGIEPGPRWDFYDAAGVVHAFRYERSQARSIQVQTRAGREVTVQVGHCDGADLAASGLDEAGLLAKYKRLVDPAVGAEALEAIGLDAPLDAVPQRLYAALGALVSQVPSGAAQ